MYPFSCCAVETGNFSVYSPSFWPERKFTFFTNQYDGRGVNYSEFFGVKVSLVFFAINIKLNYKLTVYWSWLCWSCWKVEIFFSFVQWLRFRDFVISRKSCFVHIWIIWKTGKLVSISMHNWALKTLFDQATDTPNEIGHARC